MAGDLSPIEYSPARFSTEVAAIEATKKLPNTQAIYIGWLAARYWGVPGRGWYVMMSPVFGRRLATEAEIEAGHAPRPSAWGTIVGVLVLLFMVSSAHAAEIWLGGLDPVERHRKTPDIQSDFMALFQPNAPWTTAASKLHAFGVSTQFVMQGSDADLTTTFNGLKARGIALYAEVGFLYGGGHCGKGVEGFSAPNTARALATRIKKLGGELAYAAMDEPLWFGRHAIKPGACHWDIPAIMSEIADGVAQLRQVFPNVQVGDTEPVGGHDFDWPGEIKTWFAAYKAAVGSPLAFFHADIQWSHPWQTELRAIVANARAAGIPFGPILNSDRDDQIDTDWTDHAAANLRKIEAVLGGMPDHIAVQSWQRAPSRFLPETQPGTLTNLVTRIQR